jgi:hypothetical protein
MPETSVEFAVMVPAEFVPADLRDQLGAEIEPYSGCSVDCKVKPATESRTSLDFDPSAWGDWVWIAVTVAGTSILPTAKRIANDYLWRKYQAWMKSAEPTGSADKKKVESKSKKVSGAEKASVGSPKKALLVRFRNGERFPVYFDEPADAERFRKALEKNERSKRESR